MRLLPDGELERSPVVANCRMNRERNLRGSNGYDRELGFDPLRFLQDRSAEGRRVAWLDLCCGKGGALIEAAEIARASGLEAEIVGVDLVGMFHEVDPALGSPTLIESSLSAWRPERAFDLITCVHGLHYVGDKLGLIARAVSWLAADGWFVASLDLRNLKGIGPRPNARGYLAELRRAGVSYDGRRRRIIRRGLASFRWPFRYLGADDQAGPNHTGQPAVDSYYERLGDSP